jgi:class 3 adenylate cyclase
MLNRILSWLRRRAAAASTAAPADCKLRFLAAEQQRRWPFTITMVILFADVLGAKARWHKGGREEAEKFFVLFRNLVISTLKKADIAPPREGAIETDALTLVYETAEQAISAAIVLYQAAFDSARTPARDRLWLRGAIVPYASGEPLRRLRR